MGRNHIILADEIHLELAGLMNLCTVIFYAFYLGSALVATLFPGQTHLEDSISAAELLSPLRPKASGLSYLFFELLPI